MRSLIAAITAAALLLHVSLGCCAHHAHAEEATGRAVPAAKAKCCHDHDHDGHNHADEPSDTTPTKCCHESECSFDVGAKVVAPQSDWVAPVAVLAGATPLALPVSLLHQAVRHPATFSALPLRAHLLLQVFLI
jgi:hypothetical protein